MSQDGRAQRRALWKQTNTCPYSNSKARYNTQKKVRGGVEARRVRHNAACSVFRFGVAVLYNTMNFLFVRFHIVHYRTSKQMNQARPCLYEARGNMRIADGMHFAGMQPLYFLTSNTVVWNFDKILLWALHPFLFSPFSVPVLFWAGNDAKNQHLRIGAGVKSRLTQSQRLYLANVRSVFQPREFWEWLQV